MSEKGKNVLSEARPSKWRVLVLAIGVLASCSTQAQSASTPSPSTQESQTLTVRLKFAPVYPYNRQDAKGLALAVIKLLGLSEPLMVLAPRDALSNAASVPCAATGFGSANEVTVRDGAGVVVAVSAFTDAGVLSSDYRECIWQTQVTVPVVDFYEVSVSSTPNEWVNPYLDSEGIWNCDGKASGNYCFAGFSRTVGREQLRANYWLFDITAR